MRNWEMQRRSLPAPAASFRDKKAKILRQLGVPDAEYFDASPKGSVDEGIRDLIDEINRAEGFVTTSSCAGRVSVFLEGRKGAAAAAASEDDDGAVRDDGLVRQQPRQVAGVGGKGAGGTWLHVSHDPVACEADEDFHAWVTSLGFKTADNESACSSTSGASAERRLIHFKFEPMILHVLTSSLAHAQLMVRVALQAGFRESGAINIAEPSSPDGQAATPIVAVRSMGLGFESLLGYDEVQPDGQCWRRRRLVDVEYLRTVLGIGNERFSENAKRIQRFRESFRVALRDPEPRKNPAGGEWEDAAQRKERMRAEGLRRKAELDAEKSQERAAEEADVAP
ncbi:methyltransferase [Purpureocillium takamizusanense]|uniref:tRNA(Phe) 7-[(3-amino-3-carboxypropyl)-4-demethylwyosine(37)-N(4)]-methyltransferase n=1 Tax=Purpureocillium takamizusanense TaxID=2060973 RepID=A0A9Q8Q7G7_9HYPO|nr:methyltransferase [Purpureocillium takamizusanense]UNI13783.1 methyltransferase [Purpureocillium takamizusanense]